MRKIALALLFLPLFGWAQTQTQEPYWHTLERGKKFYREGAYGEALIAFEEAKNERRNLYSRMERDMIDLLSIPEVRQLGDSLNVIELYIADRRQINAARALEELYFRVPRAELEGSALRTLDQFDRLKDYPEAEYWIGEVYRTEGEFEIALGQFQKAYEMRGLLAAPGFETEILYKIADIRRVRQEYTEMERVLEEILQGDALWSEGGSSFIRIGMSRALETDGISRFLTLYRHNNPSVLRAHELLGRYYSSTRRYNRAAEHLMFVFLIQNSLLITELLHHRYNYVFTTLDTMLQDIQRYPALVSYTLEGDYFKTMYYLGLAYYGDGKINPANELWIALSRRAEAGEWRTRAQAQLRSPFMEPMVEAP